MNLLTIVALLSLVIATHAQESFIAFQQSDGAYMLADTSTGPTVAISGDDWYGVQRAANDLAIDFGRVTGINGTIIAINGSTSIQSSVPVIIAGTIGRSMLVDSLVEQQMLDVSETEGQWEAYTTQLVGNPTGGVSQALVVAGADKRGTIYGLYDISEQIGVSPWHFWADVPTVPRQSVYAMNVTKRQGTRRQVPRLLHQRRTASTHKLCQHKI